MESRPERGPVGQVAFVLGGGGVLGAAEVGMALSLAEAGIRPDLVLGTSIGALNGCFLAADPSSGLLPWMAVLVLGRELLVTALRSFLEQQGADFSASISGKLKFILQCTAVCASLWWLSYYRPAGVAVPPTIPPTESVTVAPDTQLAYPAWVQYTVVVAVWSGAPEAEPTAAVPVMAGGSQELDEAMDAPRKGGWEVYALAIVTAAATLALGIVPQPLFDLARDASAALTGLL